MKIKTKDFLILVSIYSTLAMLALLSLHGCGNPTVIYQTAPSCTASATPQGSIISCPDGSHSEILNGVNGAPGNACRAIPNSEGAQIVCQDSSVQVYNGAAALPCTTELTSTGATISCPDGSKTTVTNGQDGLQGIKGDSGVTVVLLCPSRGQTTYPNNFPEQAFLLGGHLYAVYWDGHEAFLAEIPPGRYKSTSPQGCNFTVTSDNVVVED